MIKHTLYKVKEQTFNNASGAEYSVEEFGVMSNDSGNGLFHESGSQITGNCQFWHGRDPQAVRRYFDDPNGERYFLSENYAKKYADRMNRENPVEILPIRMFETGEIVSYNGSHCVVDGQNGRTVQLHYIDEPEHGTTAKDYEIF